MRILTWTRDERRRLLLVLFLCAAILAGFTLMQHNTPPPASLTAALPANEPLRSIPTTKKELALTFDLSWGTVMGPKVIDVLKKYHAPATFFISGPWTLQHPEIVQMIKKAGFQIESHGNAHVNYSGLSAAGVRENIAKAHAAIQQVAGVNATFVRPPNGDYNAQAIQVAASMGYRLVLWGTDSLDWMNPGVHVIIQRVVSRAHAGDIVLLHASDTCKQTDQALPTIIQDLRAKGYKLVTLNKLLTSAGA